MAQDIKLTVAAATVGPQVKGEVLKPGFAVGVLTPKLEAKVQTVELRVELVGEAV